MSGTASPIDIATARQTSSSPRNQHSNLTSQLQHPKLDVKHEVSEERSDDLAPLPRERQESIAMLGTTPYGARAIPGRRESHAMGMSGSLMGGMSWGGISMGSFIRDDIMMTGTSPYGFQSPSFHSSSYLPKMEANYMKDYICCDIHLDSMHELLQHYEEAHAAQPNQTIGRTPKDLQFPSTRAANATSTAQAVQQQAQAQQAGLAQQSGVPQMSANPSPLFSGQSHEQIIGTFDNLDGMELEDNILSQPQAQGTQFQPQPHFGRQQPRGAGVNINLANAFQQAPGLNSNGPTTPHATQQGFPNNPTVSSVNTPNISTPTTLSQQTITPDTSIPNSPQTVQGNLDYTNQMDLNSLDYAQLMQGGTDFNSLSLNGAANTGGSSGTIDDPAKRLLSKPGFANANRFGGAQANNNGSANANAGNNSELAKRLREQQLLNGLSGAGGFVGEEVKPFKCPVIGCEKAYKNQNGLKYHKQHGHQNQQLKENPDGTFSIVDPATSIPYPGTVGMEKEKPYRCEVCGKRYKNLNGLKYHRQHSPPCNPELKANPPNLPNVLGNAQSMGVNVAGAGLLGMNDGMGY
ncbi:hypothetical protein BDY17DRAFT_324224 [Neohortaea acidophila]|uniref:C2H2-type domain-containing protein n=1 Tax=Neohortaea acidophila TaxID=245834 RepID=A0A6A6PW27_9PEZI|nr:uncharacterized protein BDY17DRAFT_324224 [Neohortaea acidophila]KAF2483497.1 hypothetical protein BDY17DRAFT_324224 [Neohortaea acidophila]